MSQENVEVVRSAFRAFERGEVNEMLEWMTEDLVAHRHEPDDAVYHGKEGFLQGTADWIEGFEDWTITPEAFVGVGDSVIVRVRQAARGESSGAAVEGLVWFVLDVRGQKVSRLSFYLREAEALEAVGWRPGTGRGATRRRDGAAQVGLCVRGPLSSARRRRASAPSVARCSSRSLSWLTARPA